MKKSLKERNDFIYKYILESIYDSNSNLDFKSMNPTEKLQYLFNEFVNEKWNCENIKRYHHYNIREGFNDWLQGLPGIIHIEWEHFGVLELAKQQGVLSNNPTDNERLKILDNYWIYMTNKIFQLFRKYHINILA